MGTLERAGVEDELLLRQHLARYQFAREFARGKVVLDFGCGEGFGSSILKEVSARVVSLDVSREAMRESRAKHLTALVLADCRMAPLKSDQFDLVVSFEVFEHIERVEEYLLEAHRMLKLGGTLLISTPNVDYYPMAGLNPFHIREYSLGEVLNIVNSIGFSEVHYYAQIPREAGISRLENSNLLNSVMRFKRKLGIHFDLLPVSFQRKLKNQIAGGALPPATDKDYEFILEKPDGSILLYLMRK